MTFFPINTLKIDEKIFLNDGNTVNIITIEDDKIEVSSGFHSYWMTQNEIEELVSSTLVE